MTSSIPEERHLVSPGEIARIADVGPSAVSNWINRSDDFPRPRARSGRGDLFDLADVMAWLKANEKIKPGDEVGAFLVRHADTVRRYGVSAVLAACLVALAAIRPGSEPGEDLEDWREWLDETDQSLPAEVTRLARELSDTGLLTADDVQALGAVGDLEPALRDLIDLSADTDRGDELPADLVDKLMRRIGRVAEAEAFTDPDLRGVMAMLAWPGEGPRDSLLDPACGTGGLLSDARRASGAQPQVYGIDVTPAATTITRARFAAQGVRSTVAVADALADDPFPGLRVDCVVCDPPTGGPRKDQSLSSSLVASIGRGQFQAAELLWAYYACEHLTPTGRAVVAVPHRILGASDSEAAARFELLRRGCLQAVVSITTGSQAKPGADVALLVLRSPNSPHRGDPVLMVDATDAFLWDVFDEDGYELSVLSRFIDEPGAVATEDVIGGAEPEADTLAVVPVLELLEPGTPLIPAYWTARDRRPDADAAKRLVSNTVKQLADARAALADLHGLTVTPRELGQIDTLTVRELVDRGRLNLHRGLHVKRQDLAADEGVPVVTSTSLTAAGADVEGHLDPGDPRLDAARLTAAGDVIFSPLTGQAVVDSEGGRLAASPLVVLEQAGNPFLPATVLAQLLSGFARQQQSISPGRLDVRTIPLPALPDDTADRLARLLDTLSALDGAGVALAESVQALRNALVQAVGAGVVP